MTAKTNAYLVHFLTASGAVFAMLAMLDNKGITFQRRKAPNTTKSIKLNWINRRLPWSRK